MSEQRARKIAEGVVGWYFSRRFVARRWEWVTQGRMASLARETASRYAAEQNAAISDRALEIEGQYREQNAELTAKLAAADMVIEAFVGTKTVSREELDAALAAYREGK